MTKYTELKEKYKGKRIILHVASYLSPMKGTDYAIEAMGYVNKEFPDAELLIITSDKDNSDRIQDIRMLSFRFNANVNVVFNVPDKDMPAYYSIAECLLAPSLDENVHLPVLEASACECPCIGFTGKFTDTFGSEEIKRSLNGDVVQSRNSENMALILSNLLSCGKDYWKLNPRKFILDNFTWDKCIESYKRIIKEVTIGKETRSTTKVS